MPQKSRKKLKLIRMKYLKTDKKLQNERKNCSNGNFENNFNTCIRKIKFKILFMFFLIFVSFQSFAQVLVNDIGIILNMKENSEKLNDYFMAKNFSATEKVDNEISAEDYSTYTNWSQVFDSIAKYRTILKNEFNNDVITNEIFKLHNYNFEFKRGLLYQLCVVKFYKEKVVEIIIVSNSSDFNSYMVKVKTNYSKIHTVTLIKYFDNPAVDIEKTKFLNSLNNEALTTWQASFVKQYKELSDKRDLLKSSFGTFTDPRDGIIYKTIIIGTQTWLAENLRTTKYRNGEEIPNVTNNNEWKDLNSGAYCNYNNTNNIDTITTYGRLYNWFAVSDSRNIAPAGWHVPTDDEWTTLITSLGGESEAGGKMKEIGTTHWLKPNTKATNESGFNALPSGYRGSYGGGTFSNLGNSADFWSSTQNAASFGWYRYILYDDYNCNRLNNNPQNGFAVRLVKD